MDSELWAHPRVSREDFTKKVKLDLGLNDWILPGMEGKWCLSHCLVLEHKLIFISP